MRQCWVRLKYLIKNFSGSLFNFCIGRIFLQAMKLTWFWFFPQTIVNIHTTVILVRCCNYIRLWKHFLGSSFTFYHFHSPLPSVRLWKTCLTVTNFAGSHFSNCLKFLFSKLTSFHFHLPFVRALVKDSLPIRFRSLAADCSRCCCRCCLAITFYLFTRFTANAKHPLKKTNIPQIWEVASNSP